MQSLHTYTLLMIKNLNFFEKNLGMRLKLSSAPLTSLSKSHHKSHPLIQFSICFNSKISAIILELTTLLPISGCIVPYCIASEINFKRVIKNYVIPNSDYFNNHIWLNIIPHPHSHMPNIILWIVNQLFPEKRMIIVDIPWYISSVLVCVHAINI